MGCRRPVRRARRRVQLPRPARPVPQPAYGIFRAADAQRGPAALSVNSSPKQIRYQDEQTPDGVLYRYQGDDPENHFNRWLRAAHLLDVPIVYFVGTRPDWYRPIYPTYVERDEPAELRVLLTFGKMRGPYDEREPVHIPDAIERRYVVREVKQRIHQAQFRGAVLPAYRDRCAICRLREVRLLDAAHIVGDAEEAGEPVVSNGLSLCSIHHRAFDEDLVGVAPDLRVHVSRRLLDDEDGPMLDVLKGFTDPPSRRRPSVSGGPIASDSSYGSSGSSQPDRRCLGAAAKGGGRGHAGPTVTPDEIRLQIEHPTHTGRQLSEPAKRNDGYSMVEEGEGRGGVEGGGRRGGFGSGGCPRRGRREREDRHCPRARVQSAKEPRSNVQP